MKGKNKLFVIGIDGATFDVMRPLLKNGKMPVIKGLMDEGVYGELDSVTNMISPSAWTSFMTGKNPGKHGIYEFFEREKNNYNIKFINSKERRSASIWRMLSDSGFQVGVVNLPMTYPAEKVNGFLIAGLESPGVEAKGFTYPEGLYDELVKNCGRYIMEPGVTSHVMAGNLDEAEEILYESIENRMLTTKYLMNKYNWDIFMSVFRETDPAQHCFWRFFDKNSPEYTESPYGRGVPNVYCRIDNAIGKILEELPQDTSVMVVSDHGFGFRQHGNQCLNNWLEGVGLLRFEDKKRDGFLGLLYRQIEKRFKRKTKERLARIFPYLRNKVQSKMLFSKIDWGHTKAFADGIREGIYINLKGREPLGIVGETEYEEIRNEIIRLLKETREPYTNELIVEDVFKREEVYHGDSLFKAPDLIIRWKPDKWIKGMLLPSGRIITPYFPTEEHKTISGDHRLKGIFIVKGDGIRKGIEIKNSRIIDITPTILYMMGQPVPSDMDGKVITEIFHNIDAVKWKISQGAAEMDRETDSTMSYDKEEEESVRKRLRDLGYVE